MNPFGVIEDFERAICEYTHAPQCVAVNSCTNALFLSLMWFQHKAASPLDAFRPIHVLMPRHTYTSVPMQNYPRGNEASFRGPRLGR